MLAILSLLSKAMFAPSAAGYDAVEMTVIIIVTTATTTTDSNKAAITTTARSTSTTTATATVTSKKKKKKKKKKKRRRRRTRRRTTPIPSTQRQERDCSLTVGPPVQKAVGAELLELQTQEDVEKVSRDGREHLNVGDSEDRQDTL